MAMAFCEKCGSPLLEGDGFCAGCGAAVGQAPGPGEPQARVAPPAPPSQAAPLQAPPQPQPPVPERARWSQGPLAILAIAVVVFTAAVGGYWFFAVRDGGGGVWDPLLTSTSTPAAGPSGPSGVGHPDMAGDWVDESDRRIACRITSDGAVTVTMYGDDGADGPFGPYRGSWDGDRYTMGVPGADTGNDDMLLILTPVDSQRLHYEYVYSTMRDFYWDGTMVRR
jgi:hypothetical protein